MGDCHQAEACGPQRQHLVFPPFSEWGTEHLETLNFKLLPFSFPVAYNDMHFIHGIICKWLTSDKSELRRLLSLHTCEDNSLNVNNTLLNAGFVGAAAGKEQGVPATVSGTIAKKLEVNEDSFLQLLTSFDGKYNVQTDDSKVLLKAAVKYCDEEQCDISHIATIITWIQVSNDYTRSISSVNVLDDLLHAIIISASSEARCAVSVRKGESTSREIKICGQSFDTESNIEAIGTCEGVLQVITSFKDKKPNTPIQNLPQMASRGLAIAERSPFGNENYKTVYQLSVHAVQSPEDGDGMNDVEVLLVRSHISCCTLECMSMCPLPNVSQPSYVLHERIPCISIYNASFISTVYRAIKAVLLLFKGVDIH
ncbi:uncharacterized protein LOC144451393 [Glandiceps talaboti]